MAHSAVAGAPRLRAGEQRRRAVDRPQAGGHRAPPAIGYRPGLDGLRAVAVAAVMAQHAGVRAPGSARALVPGGFLGVDVFLVVSGFLITSLLLVERRRDGRIDLRAFWVRRARRLLPAAALLVAATSVLVVAAGLPLDVRSARGDALAALGYVANWRFVVTDQSYFAAFALPSPFRHLWSLSVEEQWYVLFPPVLIALCALARRRPAVLTAALATGALASAAWAAALHTPGTDPSRVYYGTDTRAQALLVGAALGAATLHHHRLARVLTRLAPLLGVAGLAGLAVLFATVEGHATALYRGGFLAVALVAATAVAGVALPDARGPARWLLSRRGPVLVGRLSYGLYLWHWPIYVWLTPDRVGAGGPRLLAARLTATFVVAGASYVLVERPVRHQGWDGLRRRLRLAGLPAVRPGALTAAAAAATVAVVVGATAGARAGVALPHGPGIDGAAVAVTTTTVGRGHPLPAVPQDRDLRALIGGDSVAWSLAFDQVARGDVPEGVQLRLVADLGCTLVPGVAVVDGVERPSQFCGDWRSAWQAEAFRFAPDVVVVAWGAWEVYDHVDGDRYLRAGTPEFAAAYRASLADSLDRTIAVAPDVRFAFVTVPCMAETSPRLGGPDSPRNDPARLRWVNDLTVDVAGRYGPRATVVDLGPLLCRGGEVRDEVDGVVLRDDGVHFTPEAAPMVWDYIERRIHPWLAEPAVAP
ncbi:MAG TPA: acyltransferase family protein [Acidimicrobiales bacterium]